MAKLPIDKEMLGRVIREGSFSSELTAKDLDRLRKVVKRVHLSHYPKEMITDYEADRVIDVLAPETKRYLLERAIQQRIIS